MERNQEAKKPQGPKKRLKVKAITLYVDPKYNDTVLYLKYTGGITKYFEECLEKVEIDEALMRSIKRVEFAKEGQ